MYIKVTKKTHIICFVISVILAAMLFKLITYISFLLYMRGYNAITSIIIFCVVMVPVSFIHELIHAAAFKTFGGVVKVEIKYFLYAYTQELSGMVLTRTKYAVVLLSPATIISAAAIIIPGWIGAAVFVLNIIGSVGDLYMAFNLIKYGPCKIIDKSDGFEVIKGV